MSACVVAYSRAHFDPGNPGSLYARSSAAAIAAAVYEAASDFFGSVFYVDAGKPQDWPPVGPVDAVIGIEQGFVELVKTFQPRRSLLIAVNQEPYSSAGKWLEPVWKGMLPGRALLGASDVYGRDPAAMHVADKILVVGDNRTVGTYWGVRRPSDIRAVSYGAGGVPIEPRDTHHRDTILFPSSAISLRKGSDAIEAVCQELSKRTPVGLKVVALGRPSNAYWKRQLSKWTTQYGTVFDFRGWLDPASPEYADLLKRTSCAVVPSREEGLVGAAVEAIRSGIPTFTTLECGLGARPVELQLRSESVANWAVQIVNFACTTTESGRSQIIQKQSSPAYASTEQVYRTVRNFLEGGTVHPAVWVTQDMDQFIVSRDPSEESILLTRWLDSIDVKAAVDWELDAVTYGVSLLESYRSLRRVELSDSASTQTLVSQDGASVVLGSASVGAELQVWRRSLTEAETLLQVKRVALGTTDVRTKLKSASARLLVDGGRRISALRQHVARHVPSQLVCRLRSRREGSSFSVR